MSQALRVALWVPTTVPPEVGDGILTNDNPDAHAAIPTRFSLATGGGGGGIPEAPINTRPYVRKDGAWFAYDTIDAGSY